MLKPLLLKLTKSELQNGLQPLTWNFQIENAAKVRATEIVRSFSHTRPDGSAWYTADPSVLYGENLAQYFDGADEVVVAWMNSPAHRANILKAGVQVRSYLHCRSKWRSLLGTGIRYLKRSIKELRTKLKNLKKLKEYVRERATEKSSAALFVTEIFFLSKK